MNFYETDRAVSEYLLLHYGKADDVLPFSIGPRDALDFPVRCVSECVDMNRLKPGARALDIGCAVGRASFELARLCEQVIGVDFSERFIQTAERLKRDAMTEFEFIEEGELTRRGGAVVPREIRRDRVQFERGDAQNLRADIREFDVVLLANLIDRLPQPRRCLDRLPSLVKSGGQLIITSPYTWLIEYTPRENWLGGFLRDGQPVRTFDSLQTILSPHFELVRRKDMPFLIREHGRKFQWSVSDATVWNRL